MTPVVEFFKAFRKLDRALRDLATAFELNQDEPEGKRNSLSPVRRTAQELLHLEAISEDLSQELTDLARYRNLLFHGGMKQADFGMVERARGATARLRQLLPKAAETGDETG
jgi:hypothetical protein